MKDYPHKRRTLIGLGVYLLVLVAAFGVITLTELAVETRAVSATLAFLVAAGFCAGYHRRTRGHWRDTVHGVHLMSFSAALASMLLFVAASLFGWLPAWLIPYMFAWIYLTLAFLFLWRWSILRDDQRRPVDRADA